MYDLPNLWRDPGDTTASMALVVGDVLGLEHNWTNAGSSSIKYNNCAAILYVCMYTFDP